MFSKVLIANRGEIAVRVARTCRELGVSSVAVYSDPDAGSLHAGSCDEAVHLPGRAPRETYLDVDRLLEAVSSTGAEAVHPGYGFLSENADFAEAVLEAGAAWVGPPPEAMRALGDKIGARRIAAAAGVPVVPGISEPIEEVEVLRSFAAEHGYPVAIKAAGGGGGRGLKVARSAAELEDALDAARREAIAYFGYGAVFVERYLDAPKHLEVQLLAPSPTEGLWLGVRDCSYQRRQQKLIEETPPPIFAERSSEMGRAAVAMSKASGYVNAGTAEFLVDRDGNFFFLEVNARLQVEHTVTEETYGVDLVACQLKIAAGEPLDISQEDLVARGHSIECRINAEDPVRDFLPTPGALRGYEPPAGEGIRVDTGYRAGDEIPSEYDSLLAKVVATGADREEARARMIDALKEMVVEGVPTTIPAHLTLLEHETFKRGTHTTRTVEDSGVLGAPPTDVLLVVGRPVRLWNPAMAASAAAAIHAGSSGSGEVTAPMQGTILKVLVADGDEVEAGRALLVLEAMKMETTLAAPRAGKVASLTATAGATVVAGETLAVIE
ncbi:MAG: carbamoyl phosphate synthase [Actinobacteria bacterium]|nr:carbamoyl phosphate synthase [Actinomycetota bacterium]